ncbi:hypothetical protein J4E81_000428 [Alternaria sp. BMP 2799]|nr:hypothetical protein J4E81_000428 [Alternaria sp. BMP 2799]
MAANNLRSVYQQYKHDTDVVASWPKSFGYNKPLEPPAPTEQKTQRLKGKARKAGNTTQSGSDKQTSKPKYTLAIKDFVPLSAHIAKVKGTVEVPDYFNVALDRVISVRSAFSHKLAAAGEAVDKSSDGRHSFFVTVLESVRDALKPLMRNDALDLNSIKNATPRSDKDRVRQTGLRNIFEVLDVYEPSPEFLAAPDVVPPPKPMKLDYTAEVLTDSVIDAFMAMTMLMDDLSRLRAEIADLWGRHHAGELDLATVSVATNTAIQLAHSMHDEVYPVMKHLVESVPFHEVYFLAIAKEAGVDPQAKGWFGWWNDYNFEAYDIADALFNNARNGLLVYLYNDLSASGSVMDYNGKWGRFDENEGPPPRTNKQKYARDKSTLMEVFQDLPLLHNHPGAVEDQFVIAFEAARKSYARENTNKQPPIWSCFAFQIYLDIIYSTEVGAGWTQMRNEFTTLQKYVETYPRASSEMKELVKSVDKIMEVDPIAIIRSAFTFPYKDYTVWRRNPTHCGLWIHYARNVFHREAVKYAATPGAVMCVTQLYHALRQTELLSEEWKDLQTLWDMQGNSAYFIGEPPKDFEGHWKNFLMAIGASATNWASSKRNTKVKETKANARLLKFKGPVSAWMASRISTNGDERLITAETIEDEIKEGARHHSSLAAVMPAIQRQTHVIQKLATALHAEAPEITFDYFTMHDLCWELMERMKEQFSPIIAAKSGKQWEAHKSNLPFVVGFVFSTAAGKKDIETDGVPSIELLKIAVQVTKKFLEEGKGNVITERGRLEGQFESAGTEEVEMWKAKITNSEDMTPAPPTTPHACFVCKQPAEQRCSTCSNARYCSTACQKKDWKKHKMLCKSFADLEPRPGAAFFRGLLFPGDEPLPRFVWIEYGNIKDFVSISCEPFLGRNMLNHISHTWPTLKRIPSHRVGIYYHDNYMNENLPTTPSLTKWLGQAAGNYFRGPFLAHGYENGIELDDEFESGEGGPCDLDTSALATLLALFQAQGTLYLDRKRFDKGFSHPNII